MERITQTPHTHVTHSRSFPGSRVATKDPRFDLEFRPATPGYAHGPVHVVLFAGGRLWSEATSSPNCCWCQRSVRCRGGWRVRAGRRSRVVARPSVLGRRCECLSDSFSDPLWPGSREIGLSPASK